MTRRWLAGIVLVVIGAVLLRWGGKPAGMVETGREQTATEMGSRPEPPAPELAGDAILRHYGIPAGTVQQDLRLLAEVLGNFALLLKGPDPLPLGANEELAAALLGKNRAQLSFLSSESSALNAEGQLVDRWGTPLFFHARDRQRIDIRSAGPDGVMWTEDDVHRLHDGRFLRGEQLNAPSLFEASEMRGESL